jgi:hypothetical protein
MESKSYKLLIIFIIILCIVFAPFAVKSVNKWAFGIQKADDATNYQTLKKVEDTCRAMIASYESDKITYEQYKKNDSEEKREWADQAKIRANKTASSYNNYLLENSFIWKDNIPSDIKEKLEIVE